MHMKRQTPAGQLISGISDSDGTLNSISRLKHMSNLVMQAETYE